MRRLVPFLALLGLGLPLAGCADNDIGVIIFGNYSPDPMSCSTPQSMTLSMIPALTRGTYDLGVANLVGTDPSYVMYPLIINQLPKRAGTGGIELNNINFSGYEIQLILDPNSGIASLFPPGSPTLNRTIQVFGGPVSSGGGQIVAGVSAIDATSFVLPILKADSKIKDPNKRHLKINETQTVIVHMRGLSTLHGSTVPTQWIDYPVGICLFCLPDKAGAPGVPAFDPTAALGVGECPEGGVDPMTVRNTCYPWQDGNASCCVSNGILLCGKDVPAPKKM